LKPLMRNPKPLWVSTF